MKRFLGVCLVLVMVTFLFVPYFYAQDDVEEAEEFFYGEITEVYPGSITVKGSTLDSFYEEEFAEMTFSVPENVEIDNFEDAGSLEKGMEVDIEYDVKNGENRTVRIYVYTE